MKSLLGLSLLICSNAFLPFPMRTNPLARFTVRMMTSWSANSVDPALLHAARDARGLAIDAIAACRSGHIGLPLGCAEIGAQLWGKHLNYNSNDPQWLNRDRFVLSAGHGSMFLYAWLHIAGYALPLEEIMKFRRRDSMTPGHPEFPSSKHNTPGIEATTGPLGAGIGNAVGMAVAAKMAAAKYNTPDHKIIDHHVIALCGDGCLQEGVSFEAVSFAAHEGLDNLIIIYDANSITLDKPTSYTQSENHAMRFTALGWNTIEIDGNDPTEIDAALTQAKTLHNQKPTLIIAKTLVGKGIQEIEGTCAAHGEAGITYQHTARAALGLPSQELFHVSQETKAYFQHHQQALQATYANWQVMFDAWRTANPLLANELMDGRSKHYPSTQDLFASIPHYSIIHNNKHVATRQSASEILQHIARLIPQYISGSADLHSSTKNYIVHGGDFGSSAPEKSYHGRNVHYGIREHGMGTILNGIAYYGLHIPTGATFLVFADYLRPAIRIAALAELPVTYLFTHDSIGVGEDGPTHQPVESTSALRVIPNLDVIRPADPEEVVGAFAASIERTTGPTAILLSRQTVPTLHEIPVSTRREGVLHGAYIAYPETMKLTHLILATGSEVQYAIQAAKQLNTGSIRVISMPCMERFDRQSNAYRDFILPASCAKRIAIEAGVTGLWYKYVGLEGKVIGTDDFGFSAPGEEVMEAFGITTDHLMEVIKAY